MRLVSTLTFVDTPGAERLGMDPEVLRLREGPTLNKGLLALGRCVWVGNIEHRDADDRWHAFSDADNQAIEEAYRMNKNKILLTMPQNPPGLREFEVRFGDNARSERMPRPPSTKIIQVNVASGATRIVRRIASPRGSNSAAMTRASSLSLIHI